MIEDVCIRSSEGRRFAMCLVANRKQLCEKDLINLNEFS